MIYPDVPLETWLKRYPALKDPIQCTCGQKRDVVRPWISRELVGVDTDVCGQCERPPASKYQYRSPEKNLEMLRLIF